MIPTTISAAGAIRLNISRLKKSSGVLKSPPGTSSPGFFTPSTPNPLLNNYSIFYEYIIDNLFNRRYGKKQKDMEKREEILKAARTVFARDGFNGATINEIAKEANLKSPSLLYWYFRNKQELFQAILQEISPVLSQLPVFWKRIDDPPEEMLPLISSTILRTLDNPENAEFFSIIFSEFPRNSDIANSLGDKVVLGLNFMVSYLDRQVELGRMRAHNTQSSARSFLGSFITYLMTRAFFLPVRAGLPEKETYAHDIVEVFLKGLQNK